MFPLGSSYSYLCFFPFDVSDGRCGIIVSIPDHCLPFYFEFKDLRTYPASIIYKSIAGRYRPVSYPDGPITARYRFINNASWVYCSKPLFERVHDWDGGIHWPKVIFRTALIPDYD